MGTSGNFSSKLGENIYRVKRIASSSGQSYSCTVRISREIDSLVWSGDQSVQIHPHKDGDDHPLLPHCQQNQGEILTLAMNSAVLLPL